MRAVVTTLGKSGWGAVSVIVGAIAIVLACVIGAASAHNALMAIVVAVVVLAAAIIARDALIVPILAVPATIAQMRVGDIISVSDLVLALASFIALFFVSGRGVSSLRPLVWAGSIYLAMAIPTQILNPNSANIVEWVHEVVLVLGSLIVGFVVGRENRAALALTLYLLVCVSIAIAAMYYAVHSYLVTHTFEPAYLPYLQKNTTGGMLAAGAVIAFARPVWMRWSARWSWIVFVLCTMGILAAQSRQALIGALVGVLIVSIRRRPQTGRRVKVVWLAAIPVVAVVASAVSEQLDSGNLFNSAHQRVDWYLQAVQIWQSSPIFGVGMRWWYTSRFAGQYQSFQPPNVELEVLTEVGVFGLIGFLAMFAVAAWFLWKMDPIYGTVGFAVVATRFTQTQFDLYWVAGQASLLWIVAGICYGVQQLDTARRQRGEPIPWEADLSRTKPARWAHPALPAHTARRSTVAGTRSRT